jgi:hypothetical protein
MTASTKTERIYENSRICYEFDRLSEQLKQN